MHENATNLFVLEDRNIPKCTSRFLMIYLCVPRRNEVGRTEFAGWARMAQAS